MISITLNLATN